MPNDVARTVEIVAGCDTLDKRVGEIRKIPGKHGTDQHPEIYATLARQLYVPELTPDFSHVHVDEFYDEEIVRQSYLAASEGTDQFTKTETATIKQTLVDSPSSLLVFRLITGFTRQELGVSTTFAMPEAPVSAHMIDAIDRGRGTMTPKRAETLAVTLTQIIDGTLFGKLDDGDEVRTKQAAQIDTRDGWESVKKVAEVGVPYWRLLHQRHYGGMFRQLLDATSTRRGNLIEDAVEELFLDHGVPYIRTGAHDQDAIAKRFGLDVRPAPDFVVYDASSDTLRAMLECKITNDGGTARDKAHRFERLRTEGQRLGGVPVCAVLGGTGWTRVNDTLGPIVRDTEGRVFTLATLEAMLTVTPFKDLVETV